MALTVYRHLYGYGNGRIKIAANLCAVHLFSVLLWRRHGGDRRASSGNYVGQHTGHWPLATGHRTRAYGGQWWPGKGGQVDTSCGHTNVNVTSSQTRCLYPVWAEGWHQVRGGHSHYISFFVTSLIFPLFSVTKYISSFSKALQTQP